MYLSQNPMSYLSALIKWTTKKYLSIPWVFSLMLSYLGDAAKIKLDSS